MHGDDLKQMALNYARAKADGDGLALTSVPGLRLMVINQPQAALRSIYKPLICMILQGEKSMAIGTEEAVFSAGQSVIVSADMPVTGRIVQADRLAPYIAIAVEFDVGVIREIAAEIEPARVGKAPTPTMSPIDTDEAALSCAARLLRLVDTPDAIAILHPGIMRELHYWLLSGPHGAAIRALGLPDGHAARLRHAIAHLRANYRMPIRSTDIARTSGMGETAFHRHFKALTSLTPGQFQKRLRLIEARRLMLNEGCAAGHAAFQVGYNSVSQFTREYKAFFGLAPMRSVAALGAAPERSSPGPHERA